MSLLFRIIYAAHAKGTHHKLALDALKQLTSPQTERWQRVFLKHAETYLAGSKAPDDQFKDFKNHVLHVRDGYWGGALGKADEWYAKLCTALRAQDWEGVAWSAGVLSHYITDPIQPFHTAQSAAENSIHRAAEWSISRSYDALRAQGLATSGDFIVAAGDGPTWLRDLVCRGADKANAHYETLIAHYNLNAGVVDPPAGLDALSRKILGDLVVYAAATVAAALDRAFIETAAVPPDVDRYRDRGSQNPSQDARQAPSRRRRPARRDGDVRRTRHDGARVRHLTRGRPRRAGSLCGRDRGSAPRPAGRAARGGNPGCADVRFAGRQCEGRRSAARLRRRPRNSHRHRQCCSA
jgi:hypothetical protein